MDGWKEIWGKRPFQMTPEELAEYERVKDTAKWKKFERKMERKIKMECRAGNERHSKLVKLIPAREITEAEWLSIPGTSSLPSVKIPGDQRPTAAEKEENQE
jgi:hypothetical protein